jgi:two-component system response regulator
MTEHYMRPSPILVVDDNEDDYEAIARAFKKIGLVHPVSLCTTGQGAMDFLRREGIFKEAANKAERPVLIMLDLNMPGMDGLQVLQHIRQDAGLRQIPVVIWTTSSNEKDVDACYQMGANAYMQKPVIFDELVESVKRLKEYWFETVLLPAEGGT